MENMNLKSRDLICIGCPLGCGLHVEWEKDSIKLISGNQCKIGADYAGKEVTNPTRILTTTVKVIDGASPVVSVKTNRDIPKSKIQECMKAIKACRVTAPVYIGDILLENPAGIDAAIIATRNVEKVR